MMLTWTPSGLMAMKLLVGHVISQTLEDTREWLETTLTSAR